MTQGTGKGFSVSQGKRVSYDTEVETHEEVRLHVSGEVGGSWLKAWGIFSVWSTV